VADRILSESRTALVSHAADPGLSHVESVCAAKSAGSVVQVSYPAAARERRRLVTLVESCPGCGHKVYAIAEPSRLIDATAWDGNDLFIVWPLPGYQFASNRLASILRQEQLSGVKLLPASDLPVRKGNHITPGSLALHMPESRARELGQRFGIS
jgi:hypothetical protein